MFPSDSSSSSPAPTQSSPTTIMLQSYTLLLFKCEVHDLWHGSQHIPLDVRLPLMLEEIQDELVYHSSVYLHLLSQLTRFSCSSFSASSLVNNVAVFSLISLFSSLSSLFTISNSTFSLVRVASFSSTYFPLRCSFFSSFSLSVSSFSSSVTLIYSPLISLFLTSVSHP